MVKTSIKILGIETSCDETAAAIISAENESIKVLSNVVSSQIKLHAKWGGVVPNLAAREHLKNILPVIEAAIKEAPTSLESIDLIAVTNGPGLIPALLVGTNAAKTLAYINKKPLIGIHHIEGHIYANFIENIEKEKIAFPVLCLVVSGGHTQLIYMKNHLNYKIIGETQDDAAGEAFDKVARILQLSYPGGPAIAQKATQAVTPKPQFDIKLPRPMIDAKNYNFSFSGLKTAVLYTAKKNQKLLENKQFVAQMSAEFQQAVIDVLIKKTISAAKEYKPKTIIMAGGVSANAELRAQMGHAIIKELPGVTYKIPRVDYSMDNAAMIATAGYFRWMAQKNKYSSDSWKNISADASLEIN